MVAAATARLIGGLLLDVIAAFDVRLRTADVQKVGAVGVSERRRVLGVFSQLPAEPDN